MVGKKCYISVSIFHSFCCRFGQFPESRYHFYHCTASCWPYFLCLGAKIRSLFGQCSWAIPGVGDGEACELTPWCNTRQDLAPPQGTSSSWGEWRGFRWNWGSKMKKIVVSLRIEKPGTSWTHPDLLLVVPPKKGKTSVEKEDLKSFQLCCMVNAVESGYCRNWESGLIFLSMQMCKIKWTYHLYWKLNVQCREKSIFTMKSHFIPHMKLYFHMTEVVLV